MARAERFPLHQSTAYMNPRARSFYVIALGTGGVVTQFYLAPSNMRAN